MLTGHDRLARLWGPAVASMVTTQDIDNRKRLARALTDDGMVRPDAMPETVLPITYQWIDTGTVAVQVNLPSYKLPVRCQLRAVHAHIYTAPTGQSLLGEIDTTDNDTLAEFEIVAGANYGSVEGLAVDIEPGTWIRETTTQVGSGTAGSNLTVVAFLFPEWD